jgi:hypothetical protein
MLKSSSIRLGFVPRSTPCVTVSAMETSCLCPRGFGGQDGSAS